MKKILLSWLLLFSDITRASQPYPIGIMLLYQLAEVVALVQIESGELIEGTDIPCGAKYQAKVIHPLKNVELNQKLSFGYHYGIEVGSEYLVLLAENDTSAWPKLSFDSSYDSYRAQFDRQCQSKHPKYNLMRNGGSFFKLEYHVNLKGGYGFQVSTNHISIPQGANPQKIKGDECPPWDCVWVAKKDMLNVLDTQKSD